MPLASGRPLEGPKLLAIRDHRRHELAGDAVGQVENDLRHGPWIRVAQPYKKKGAAAPFEVLPIVSQLSADDREFGCGGPQSAVPAPVLGGGVNVTRCRLTEVPHVRRPPLELRSPRSGGWLSRSRPRRTRRLRRTRAGP